MCHVPFILTLTIQQTTATPNHLLHQCQSVHPPAVSVCTCEVLALTSTACSINYTAPQHIHFHLQGKFLHLLCRLSSIFHIACYWCKLILLISDGGSAHPLNAQGWGLYPMRYSPEPGRDQPRGHPFLSPVVYSPHAMPLPQQPAHSPLRGCICTPAIQHAP